MPVRFMSWNIQSFTDKKAGAQASSASWASAASDPRLVARMAQVIHESGANLVGIEEVKLVDGKAAVDKLVAALNAKLPAGVPRWASYVSDPNVPPRTALSARADRYAVLYRAQSSKAPPSDDALTLVANELPQPPAYATTRYPWIDRCPLYFVVTCPGLQGGAPVQFAIWHAAQEKNSRTNARRAAMIGTLADLLDAKLHPVKRTREEPIASVAAGDFNVNTTRSKQLFQALAAAGLSEDAVGGSATTLVALKTFLKRVAGFTGPWTRAGFDAQALANAFDDVYASPPLTLASQAGTKQPGAAGDVIDIPFDLLQSMVATNASSGARAAAAFALGRKVSDHCPVVTTIS